MPKLQIGPTEFSHVVSVYAFSAGASGFLVAGLADLLAQVPAGAPQRTRRIRAIAPLEFVNGGGTGSLESTSADKSVTEQVSAVAGSG